MSPARAALLLSLVFLSGVAALIYEVLWLEELGRLFGVTAHAAATTLAAFFLGLAAGSLALGRRAERMRSPLRAYALLELGIAATALLYFLIFDVYRWLHPLLFAAAGDHPLPSLLVKFLLATGILFPPALFMGGTLPVMAQLVVRRSEALGRWASLLYALNTAGAACGALLAGFVLPRYLGFTRSYLVAIALNGIVAAAAWSSSRSASEPGPAAIPDSRPRPPAAPSRVPARLIPATAFLSGLLTLALEVLWTRMLAQVLQNSVYTFSAILVVFLLALSLGSGLAHLLCRLGWPAARVLFGLLTASGLLVGLTPLFFYRATAGLQPAGTGLDWGAYVASIFGLTASVLLLPTAVMGAVFPYLMRLSETGMVSAGRTVGRLASLNTFAAILGSLAAGFALLPGIGLWASIRLVAVLYLGLALAALARQPRRFVLGAAPALGILLFAFGLTYSDFSLAYLDPERNERLVEAWEGSHGTVVVVSGDAGLGIKVDNSQQLGTSRSALNARIQTWLALGLHRDPRSVFFLGMGTGLTASGALDLPVDRVVVCELNGDVIQAARKHFRPWLNGLFEDPRVSVRREDGRSYLMLTGERFDAIIADIFLTYKAGIGSLYTLEHFQTARSRLNPGGIFVQWLPLFEMSEQELGIVARTMLEVFPQVTLWRRGFSPRFPVFALVGHDEPAPVDAGALQSRLGALAARGALPRDVWIRNIPLAAYAGNLTALRSRFDRYPLSTDDRALIEYLAPITERDGKAGGETPVLAWTHLASFCESLLRQLPPERDPFLRGLDVATARQVDAGLAYYWHTSLLRSGREREAEQALERYRALLAPHARRD